MNDIKGYEGLYKITTDGKVWSFPKGRRNFKGMWLKPRFSIAYPDGGRYICYSLTKNNILTNVRAHRLVAQTFISNPENKPQVNHKNGIKSDNRVENLEWCTVKENHDHAIKNNLYIKAHGERNNHAKLKEKDVLKIREITSKNIRTYTSIAKEYNVHVSLIGYIAKRSIWKHI